MARASLDEEFTGGRGRTLSLRWVYTHMIEEYARHNGHADLLRQRIDGRQAPDTRARQEAAARGVGLIRVDCWAGQDGSLVRVYEKYGFSRVQDFTVALPAGDWPGALLAMRLARQRPGCR